MPFLLVELTESGNSDNTGHYDFLVFLFRVVGRALLLNSLLPSYVAELFAMKKTTMRIVVEAKTLLSFYIYIYIRYKILYIR